ncbi:hypothetical protein GMDG_05009 [Pseudogymnoascus destructans 20631-21]|uniref:Uncharacterized protein n=2 Tax=Pseudogymnoascus destructans TaxID=655981 RepID=L8GD27_PSED2|nr:hypothetical protein GMDG_05009 [Pseudogymnoascus destructans 20631-21]
MSQLTPQTHTHCSACEATAAQWTRVNACTHSNLGLSSPGKPYPIPPTLGTESHPYARQIGETQFMTAPEPEVQVTQNKVWIQPEYDVVVKKDVDMDYIKELIANIVLPGSKSEDEGPMPPRPTIPTLSGVPPNYCVLNLKVEDAIPPPRPNVPGRPPRKSFSGVEMVDAIPPPRPYVPTPPYELLSGFQTEDAFPTPRPNVPLPPDAPPNQGLSGFQPEDAFPPPRPYVPLPPDAPPNQ